jgi:hypothetical protein
MCKKEKYTYMKRGIAYYEKQDMTREVTHEGGVKEGR